MTAKQRIHLMADLWPCACRCQGWDPGDRARRLQVFSEALGRPVSSANELDSTGDYDAVKAHLGMLSDNLDATIETDHPEIGQARRMRGACRRYLQALRTYYPDPDALLSKLIRDKFGSGWSLDQLTDDPIIVTDSRTGRPIETASQLDQILFTLARILSAKRKAS